MFFSLVIIVAGWAGFNTELPPLSRLGIPSNELGRALVIELGAALVTPDAYVIPFEVASILLLIALIGAIIIAWQRD